MPALMDAPKVEAELTRQIESAAGRIRLADVLSGVVGLLALTLSYALFVIVLDKWLVLPDWLRQVGFAAFLLGFGALAYRRIVRPTMLKINPLYAAKKVESTNPDAKNAIVNWVDLADEDLPSQVKAAVAQRAVQEVREAEVAKVGESASLVKLGAVAVACFVALLVLVVAFSPSQFKSLAARAFTPFASPAIASKTKIELKEPVAGDVTITAGQSVVVHVEVTGRIPESTRPEKLRVLVRYNTIATEFEEIALEPGTTNRDWEVRLPASIIQNGCRYRVVGGDGETPEYTITVRPAPMLTGFEAKYEYPTYTRIPPETLTESKLEGFRGTKVTLTVTTNREVRNGTITFDTKAKALTGTVVGDNRMSLRFDLTLEESTYYRIGFTSTTGETNTEQYPYPIKVIGDKVPVVTITKPTTDISLRPNGRLEVDATSTDDVGVAAVTLKLRLAGTPIRNLQSKVYLEGKSLKRETDGSYPTRLESKDSLDLATLKDEAGQAVALKAGDIIEYWVEATDNCTEPIANVGQSKIQKLTILPPEPKPELKDAEANAKAAAKRKQDEQKHAEKQQDKFNKENREAPPPRGQNEPKPNEDKTPKEDNPNPMGGEKGNPEKQPNPMGGMNDPNPMPMGGEKGTPEKNPNPMGGEKGTPEKNHNPMGGNEGTGSETPKTDPKTKEDLTNKANDIAKELDKQEKQPGDAKASDRTDEGMKDQPPQAGNKAGGPPDAGAKPETKPGDNPAPKENPNEETKPGPLGGSGGDEKPVPQEQPKNPMDTEGTKPKPNPEQTGEAKSGQAAPPAEKKQGPPEGNTEPQAEPKKGPPEGGNAEPKDKGDGAGGQQPQGNQKPNPDDENKGGGAGQPGPGGAGQEDKDKVEKATRDLASGELERLQGARSTLDEKVGPEKRKQMEGDAERLQKDLKSDNKETREKAQEKLDKMVEQAKKDVDELAKKKKDEPKTGGTGGDPKNMEKAGQDIANGDKNQKQQGEQKLTEEMKKAAKAKAEQLEKDLKSDDPAKKAAAEKELKDLAKEMEKQGQQGAGEKGGTPSAEKMKELADAAKDLNNPDPAKQKAAQDKLDKELGKDARAKAEQLAKDLQGNDAGKKAAAEKELKEMAEQAGKQANNDKGLSPEEKKNLDNAAKAMAGQDEKGKKEASDAIQKAMEKNAKAKAEQLAKDLKSDNPETKAAAEKELKELADKMAKENEKNKDKKMSPEEAKEWANKAKDLNSPDKAAKEKAEKEFDDKFGQDNRKGLQDKMKDTKPNDPKAEEMAKDFMNNKFDPDWQSGGGGNVMREGTKLDDDPRSRLRTKELQLQQFEKNKYREDLLKKLGVGQEDYQKFIDDFKKLVDEEKKEVAAMEKEGKLPPAKPSVNVNAGSGGNKLVVRPDGTTGPAAVGNAVTPQGYGEAQKRFAEEIRKQNGGDK